MADVTYPRIDITPTWARLNEELIRLVDYVPDDKMGWSPRPELWSFRDIMLHMPSARDIWMRRDVKDGIDAPDVLLTVRTRAEIQQAYVRTWERLQTLLRDDGKLDTTYTTPWETTNGHWLAFHALEHDIHHRADILHYLALLGIDTPEVGTP